MRGWFLRPTELSSGYVEVTRLCGQKLMLRCTSKRGNLDNPGRSPSGGLLFIVFLILANLIGHILRSSELRICTILRSAKICNQFLPAKHKITIRRKKTNSLYSIPLGRYFTHPVACNPDCRKQHDHLPRLFDYFHVRTESIERRVPDNTVAARSGCERRQIVSRSLANKLLLLSIVRPNLHGCHSHPPERRIFLPASWFTIT